MERCGYDIKGSTFLAYLRSISAMGNLVAEIRPRLEPETVRLIDQPPIGGVWMDGYPVEDMNLAVAAVRGYDVLPGISARAMANGMTPLLRPVVEGMLRLFVPSPATLFSRFPTITRSSVRGVEFVWTGAGDKGGTMAVRLPRPDAGMHVLLPFCGSFEHTITITGHKGLCDRPEVTRDTGTTAKYKMSWR